MERFGMGTDVTAEEAAAVVAALQAYLAAGTEPPSPRLCPSVWARAGQLEALGYPVRENLRAGWKVRCV